MSADDSKQAHPHRALGLELERAQRDAALEPAELATGLGLDPRTIRRYLNGERIPKRDVVDRWEGVCGISDGWLIRFYDEYCTEGPPPAAYAAATPQADGDEAQRADDRTGRLVRWRWIALLGVFLFLAAGAALLLVRDDKTKSEQTIAAASDLTASFEVTGGPANTWSDYETASIGPGPRIQREKSTVRVTCRVQGYRVPSRNNWWYLIASSPWDQRYFVTADAFYNQPDTSGPLKDSPFVDEAIPVCPEG